MGLYIWKCESGTVVIFAENDGDAKIHYKKLTGTEPTKEPDDVYFGHNVGYLFQGEIERKTDPEKAYFE